MTQSTVRLLPVVLAASLLLSFGIARADAQSNPASAASAHEDRVSQQDRSNFAAHDITRRFGITFRPHAAVCDSPAAGDAACNARVVESWLSPDGLGKGANSNATTPPPSSVYGPAQFLTAYGLSGQANGTPLIAIVDAYDDPNIASDLNAYSSAYGIPQLPACSGSITNSAVPCFQKVNQNGSTGSLPSANASWALEISLDVEVAHALCQNCRILLVEASSNSYSNLFAAEDRAVAMGATVVSNSWGGGEGSGENTYDSHFNHPGVAFTFSAGDSGYGAEYPAASPAVTAVGGTSLFLNADNTYNSELAWSGTGSGCSAYESKPSWQHDPSCAKRTVADVSADADPNTGAAVYDSYGFSGQRGWFQVGGTSLASPLIAATYALAGTAAGSIENSLPYVNANALGLRDVVSGSNGSCSGSYLCTAVAGFDGPTGLGSPLGLAAFSPVPPPPPPPPTPSVSIDVSPASITLGQSSTLSWNSTDVSSCTASGNWAGAQALSGTLLLTPAALGIYRYQLDCTGSDGNVTGSSTLMVNPAPVQSFTLTALPSSLSIRRGSNGNDTISVVPAGGFSGPVSLSISGVPSGVHVTASPNPMTTSSVLHFTVDSRTARSTYTLTVTGTSGSLTSNVNLSLTVR